MNSAKSLLFKLAKKVKPTIPFAFLSQLWGELDRRAIEVLIDEELEKQGSSFKTVLYMAAKYDYGNREWGLSYEYFNFYPAFLKLGIRLIYFPIDKIAERHGTHILSQMLRDAVLYYRPNILFYSHFHNLIDHKVWKELQKKPDIKTVIWLTDDQWQYEETRSLWESFNLVVTNDENGYQKRKKENFPVFLSQWACNPDLYNDLKLPRIYEVSFVGRAHGIRKKFIEQLKKRGITITTFGPGWEGGSRISQADLIRIYNQSKVSLNISLTSQKRKDQIKARDFEVPACGSLLMTKEMKGLSHYLLAGKEIVTYKNVDDAAKNIRYYLSHDREREVIAEAGYVKVHRDHTYEKRLWAIFHFLEHG